VIYLSGELGSGKSTLARGVLRAMGVMGRIKSPTYALVENYSVEFNVNSRLDLYHFDLYRFIDPSEWRGAGFSDLLQPGTMSLIEWPEKALGQLPTPDLAITLSHTGTSRSVSLAAASPTGQAWLQHIQQTLGASL
jgi:tRNA threonylcarbamoyladenosine biosynthesis protein TsaE